MKIEASGDKPIKMWLDDIEDGALAQARNLARLPFLYKHVALMPDCHQGYGMPIGGVIACDKVVVPNAVGVDIGCGMMAVETDVERLDEDMLKDIMGEIRLAIPVGFNHHDSPQDWVMLFPHIEVIQQEKKKAMYQLGTLGGGNHFIEIQRSDKGNIWIMIHSGSRNFGYKIAKYYNEMAQKLCRRWYSDIPEFKGEDGLAFLPIDDPMGEEYMQAMDFALCFAKWNRGLMMERIREIFIYHLNAEFLGEVNIHHNYAAWENHFGKNVIVHRKGATSAREGELGIIPSSQGTPSYIVRGKGNPQSFMSCSHGAGRKMGRNEARKKLSLEDEQKRLDEKGIIHSIRHQKDLDEASGAYKDIDVVMENQKDLVEIVTKLEPLAVIKG